MQKRLPKGWRMARLGEVVSVDKGKKMTLLDSYCQNSQPYIGIDNLRTNEYTNFTSSKNGLSCVNSDLLIAWDGANAGTVGYGLAGFVGSTIARLHPNEKIRTEFLGYFLKTKFAYFNASTHGAAIPHLSKTRLLNTVIPLPPLLTQKKIVEISEEADSLRKLRKQADEKMRDLIPSLFVRMFGDPATNPKGWRMARLGEVTQIVSGSTPKTEKPEYWNGDILWATPADLSNLNVIMLYDTERRITKEGFASCSTTMLPKGSVLFSSRAPIGHLAIAGKEMCTNQGFKSLIPKENVLSFYLYFILKYFKERLINLGSGATFKEISKTSVERFEIPLPPLPLQQEFAARVEEIEAEKARQAESKTKLDELFNSLMQKAFTGELVA